ncbi:MAG: diguanylate cyclase [Deltaproteobacteria bacterium]|nr:diguanylate cyclase [Deltaproteobacteria bacterium]
MPNNAAAGLSKGRILIIDDNRTNTAMVKDVLLANGFEALSACNGPDGIGAAAEFNPAVILLDLIMPGMDGIAVCRKIRGLNLPLRPSIIVVSVKNGKDAMVEALQSGADDFIVKPIHEGELLSRINAQLRIAEFYKGIEEDKKNLEKILSITNAISSTLDPSEVLGIIVKEVAEATNAVRCSIVLIVKDDEGYVLASHDDPGVKDLRLDLSKYPEIREAVATKKVLTIDDMAAHPLTEKIKEQVKGLKGMSVLIMPIVFNDDVLGTIILRTRRGGRRFSDKEKTFCNVVANASFHAIKNARLFEKVTREKEHLREMAIKDQLTSLYNHNFFYTRLEEEFERAVRYELPLGLIMMDIDDFKKINDTYGHRAGDGVLKDISALIKKSGRKTDIVARYGGEEFAVILPHTTLKGSFDEAERLRHLIESHTYAGLLKTRITMSLGVAAYPNGVMNSGELVNRADNALYKAKWNGKNRVCMDTEEEDDIA